MKTMVLLAVHWLCQRVWLWLLCLVREQWCLMVVLALLQMVLECL
jgi:hypothetical protein